MIFIILDFTNISHVFFYIKYAFFHFTSYQLANLTTVRHCLLTMEYSLLDIHFDGLNGKQKKKGKPPTQKIKIPINYDVGKCDNNKYL